MRALVQQRILDVTNHLILFRNGCSQIPRFLRREGQLSFPEMALGEAEAAVAALWRAKRDNDASSGRLHHVGDFMFHWATRVAGEPDVDRITAAAYRLLVSCTNHAPSSPQIALFLEVTAKLPLDFAVSPVSSTCLLIHHRTYFVGNSWFV
jgi:hypothetical protein